ncbi:hypothetical protein ACTMTI_50610 [Nonomuraea sp. H19]|uniref:hypothetical protein n=1 Tax=Nonomuraea sp. H19 TaxID=3452206 RepID=UPI003F8B159E
MTGCLISVSAGSADVGVWDLVIEQRIQLGGLGGGVAEAAADGLDGDADVDEFGGVGVAQ